jgi:hypothetical protein
MNENQGSEQAQQELTTTSGGKKLMRMFNTWIERKVQLVFHMRAGNTIEARLALNKNICPEYKALKLAHLRSPTEQDGVNGVPLIEEAATSFATASGLMGQHMVSPHRSIALIAPQEDAETATFPPVNDLTTATVSVTLKFGSSRHSSILRSPRDARDTPPSESQWNSYSCSVSSGKTTTSRVLTLKHSKVPAGTLTVPQASTTLSDVRVNSSVPPVSVLELVQEVPKVNGHFHPRTGGVKSM